MDSTLDVARLFVQAVQDRNADAAAALCADDVEVTLPGLPEPFQGKEGVRQMIRFAPSELVQTPRDESVDGKNVKITTLTRAPGVFANYTTWNFEIDGALVRRLSEPVASDDFHRAALEHLDVTVASVSLYLVPISMLSSLMGTETPAGLVSPGPESGMVAESFWEISKRSRRGSPSGSRAG